MVGEISHGGVEFVAHVGRKRFARQSFQFR